MYATMGIYSVYIILLSKHLLGNVDIASKTQILFEILCFHKVAWVYFLKLPHNHYIHVAIGVSLRIDRKKRCSSYSIVCVCIK